MIALALAVIFLHLITVPVSVGADLNIDWDARAASLSVYVAGFRVANKRKKLGAKDGEHAEDRVQKTEKKFKPNKFVIRFATEMLRLLRVRFMELSATIGTGDAATTAAAVGGLRIFYSQLCALLCYEGSIRHIVPDYDGERVCGSFCGIFSLCFADIIFAAARAFARRRGKERRYANVVTE